MVWRQSSGTLPLSRIALLEGETLTHVWLRRLVTIPGYFVVFALALLSSPAWLVGSLLWDQLTGATQRPRTRCLLFLFYYLFSEIWGIVAYGLVWLFFSWGDIERYHRVNFWLQGVWASSIFQGARVLFQVRVEVEGQDLAKESPFYLLVRHTSLADTVLAATFIAHPHRIGLRYVLKRELIWDPCLDIVGRRLPNHFVDRSGKRSEQELKAVKALAQNLKRGEGVLIYPEGTRFSPAKKERALARLREQGRSEFADRAQSWQHLLPPRPGGVLALFEEQSANYAVILAHTGLEGAARWKDFWAGSLVNKTLRIKISRYNLSEIPTEERIDWLYSRWTEVNDWVEEHYEY